MRKGNHVHTLATSCFFIFFVSVLQRILLERTRIALGFGRCFGGHEQGLQNCREMNKMNVLHKPRGVMKYGLEYLLPLLVFMI